jgi:adenylate cyclase
VGEAGNTGRAGYAQVEHRLAVIMCADVVGYSRLMGIDEEGTLAALNMVRRDLVDPAITEHKGRIVRAMGDGLLVEFQSVVDAVRCAVEIQRAMPKHGPPLPVDRRIRFRVAINIGDVVSDGDMLHGEGVAIAARLESLAEPDGINVSRAVRDQVRDRLPLGFADLGEHEIENVARPVRAFRILPAGESAAPGRGKAAAAPERPAVAVLPFQNLGGDEEAEFFLDSLAEDLITELSRSRWFSVVARNTSFGYKGTGADAKRLARELAVRYVVEGSMRKAGNRVRIGCQLVEAASGQQLWADRFDGTLEDSFDLQDRVTERVAGAVAPVLRGAEIERARRKPDAELDTYDLALRALTPAFAETPRDNEEALGLTARALSIDPAYPAANALAAWCLQQRHLLRWPGGRADDREAAKRLARRAISEGADAPSALAVAGAVRAALTRDHDLALAAVDRAVMLNPNTAFVLGFDAMTRCICGAYDKAIDSAGKAVRLSPVEPLGYHAEFALSFALLMTGRAEEALAHAKEAIEANPNFVFGYCVLALGHARLSDAESAAGALRRLLAAAPGFRLGSLRAIRFADSARLGAELDTLRGLRLPE